MENVTDWLYTVLPYVIVFVAVFAAYLLYGAVKALHKQTPSEPGLGLDDVAWIAVTGVEQMFFDKDGEFKLDEAMAYVKKFAPNADDSMIRIAIESAVKIMNDNLPH